MLFRGKVVSVHGEKVKMYRIWTRFGLLKNKIRGGDLQEFTDDEVLNETKTIVYERQLLCIAVATSLLVRRVNVCLDVCTCKEHGVECSTYCHPETTCANRNSTEKHGTFKPVFKLTETDEVVLNDLEDWLNDKHMLAAMTYLNQTFPFDTQSVLLYELKPWHIIHKNTLYLNLSDT